MVLNWVHMVKDPKDTVQEIVSELGKAKAERLLIAHDVSPSAAGKLVRGTYASEVGALLSAAIERARVAARKSRAS